MSDFAGLEELSTVRGGVTISGNDALTSVQGLNGLKSAYTLMIVDIPALTELDGLGALTTLSNNPAIGNNAQPPACWADRMATQTGKTCNCMENGGEGDCL